MESLFDLAQENLPMSLRIFRQIIKEHGWQKVNIIRSARSYISAIRPDGKKIEFCSLTTPSLSYYAGSIANDKFATYCLLKSLGILQPDTTLLSKNNYKNEIRDYVKKYHAVVIKPNDGAHGDNVFTDLTTFEDALDANNYLYALNPRARILVQEQIISDKPEIRVICIDKKFVAAYKRIPAKVTGDGIHTVSELIDIENSTIRTKPYHSNLSYIDRQAADHYINQKQIAELIPKKGEKIRVVKACNTGKGGTMVDVSSTFPVEKQKEAETIAKAAHLPVVGIDYFGDYCVEINNTPSLYHPVKGPGSTLCIEEWVKLLER